jgi:hypothetical protein
LSYRIVKKERRAFELENRPEEVAVAGLGCRAANRRLVECCFIIFVVAGGVLAVEASQFVVRDDGSLLEQFPSVAYNLNDGSYLVVWHNDRAGNDDIRAQRLDGDGNPLGGAFYISAGPGADRRKPDVAYDDRNDQYLVVWEHHDQITGYGIFGRRVSGSGAVLDSSDILIRGTTLLSTVERPAVSYAFTSDKFMVVWQETWLPSPVTYSIAGRIVDKFGMLSGPQIAINSASNGDIRSRPDIAYNRGRNEHLVVWQQLDSGGGIDDVVGQRISALGVMLGDPWRIAYFTSSSNSPAVSALPNVGTDGQYLVVSAYEDSPTDWDIQGQFVDGDGTQSLPDMDIATSGNFEALPSISAIESQRKYLVCWSRHASPSGLANLIRCRLVEWGGEFGRERTFGGDAGDRSAVAGASNGADFLIVFEDTPVGIWTTGIYGSLYTRVFEDSFESGDTVRWSQTVP